ncbi:MAG: helix-turn-helix domain-containing protein [Alphaproteobacteria bacterium]
MDALITAAARALAAGDLFGALNQVALREDAPALALRGIAMARLGDLDRAKVLLRRAADAFSPKESVARARCALAEAEIALVSRDLSWRPKALEAATATLERRGDRVNAAFGRSLEIRRLLLTGRLDEAERKLKALDPEPFPPALRAVHELTVAGFAMRRLRIGAALGALARAKAAAREADIPALTAEIESASLFLTRPSARLIARGEERPLLLDQVEALIGSDTLIVDACRHVVRHWERVVSLATRPVLFTLVRTLGEAWPEGVTREKLLTSTFCAKHADDSHRARLRVEIARLRAELQGLAEVTATGDGFAITPCVAAEIVVLAPPIDGPHGALLALLADGEAWSSSALALALGTSQRSVQRSLEALAVARKVESLGRGRARRWTTPLPGFATILLLPGPLPSA